MHKIILAKTAGSTLIELTVVVTIIASLAAMAVPTVVTYRDKSRVTRSPWQRSTQALQVSCSLAHRSVPASVAPKILSALSADVSRHHFLSGAQMLRHYTIGYNLMHDVKRWHQASS